MLRVIHFEIHAGNPQRAIGFYSALFGWQFQKWGDQDYWIVITGAEGTPGINGGLLPRRGENPAMAGEHPVISYVCTVDVPKLDDAIAQANTLGGMLVVPKMAIPTVGWLAYEKDPEGNLFGMMENDPNAK
jgi:hypothetical protein